MIRILVTGFTSNIGGIETFIINHYRVMRKVNSNIVFDVMCYTDHPAFEQEIISNGGKIIKIPLVRNPKVSRYAVDDYFKEHASEYLALWCNKCDLLNIDFIIAAHNYGISHIIIHSHNSFNMHSGIKKLLVSIMHSVNKKRITKYVSDYWSCSDYAAEWMFPNEIVNKQMIKYIPNAVDADLFRFDTKIRNNIRDTFGFKNKLVIGFVGRLSYMKNPIFAISIFNEICKLHSDSEFIIIGTGELEERVKKYADSLTCMDRINFLGRRNDVPELMQAMDCMLLPSHFEGLPVVAVEAQAAGLHIFAASDGITEQTKITDLLHFLPLSAGAEKWAETILNTNLERKDTYDEIVKAGFELNSAAKKLFERFAAMQNG